MPGSYAAQAVNATQSKDALQNGYKFKILLVAPAAVGGKTSYPHYTHRVESGRDDQGVPLYDDEEVAANYNLLRRLVDECDAQDKAKAAAVVEKEKDRVKSHV